MIKENSNEIFWEIQRTLGWEFSRYILARHEIAEKIPDGAEIVFQIKGNAEFNRWSKSMAHDQHEPRRPVILIKVDGLAPPPPVSSRLINPRVALVKNI